MAPEVARIFAFLPRSGKPGWRRGRLLFPFGRIGQRRRDWEIRRLPVVFRLELAERIHHDLIDERLNGRGIFRCRILETRGTAKTRSVDERTAAVMPLGSSPVQRGPTSGSDYYHFLLPWSTDALL